VLKEAEITSQLQHPNIVKFVRMIETDTRLLLVMEWVKGGQLMQMIEKKKQERKPFTDEEAATIMRSLLSAVAYIHSKDIIHRDMKPGKN